MSDDIIDLGRVRAARDAIRRKEEQKARRAAKRAEKRAAEEWKSSGDYLQDYIDMWGPPGGR